MTRYVQKRLKNGTNNDIVFFSYCSKDVADEFFDHENTITGKKEREERIAMLSGIATGILLVGGAVALALRKKPMITARIGVGAVIAAAIPSLFAVILVLFMGAASLRMGGEGHSWIFDHLSAIFLLPIVILSVTCAIHATEYFRRNGEERSGIFWCFFLWMIAAMTAVVSVTEPTDFLLAWELMGVRSFALVIFDYKERVVLRAGWVYLLACHAGAALLILFFLRRSMAFEWPTAGTVFALAMLGFGLKAGFVILHVWLPEAHPAAPSPVSAVMSGAMINLGLYGILRFACEGVIPAEITGWTLLLIGMTGALFGILFALPQRNIKTLLAYSSIENIGIISIGFGLGFAGINISEQMCFFGFLGAFLHLWNHALLKGGLFLGAGAVMKACHSLEMDRMGGLMQRIPRTGALFALNSCGISGLPPLNGFLGELFLYLAAFSGIISLAEKEQIKVVFLIVLVAVPVVLSLTGGLAVAVFAKVVGAVFLGEPRSLQAAEASEHKHSAMTLATLILFGLCIVSAAFSALMPKVFAPVIAHFISWSPETLTGVGTEASEILLRVSVVYCVVIVLFGLIVLWRMRQLRRQKPEIHGTWDCAFALPTARMEYTCTAFSQPLLELFRGFFRPRKKIVLPKGLFPNEEAIEIDVEDAADRMVWDPLFVFLGKVADKVHKLQSGYLHLYILIMVLALLGMLIWGLLLREDSGGVFQIILEEAGE